MPKCLFTRCFFCINLRTGCAFLGSVLLLIKMTECFLSTIAAIDYFEHALKDKSRHNMESGGERLGTFTLTGFHWITMMIVCVLLEGLRKKDLACSFYDRLLDVNSSGENTVSNTNKEPSRVCAFNVCTMVAYAVYIPIFIFLLAKNGGGYSQHDWTVIALRIGIIGWYVYVMLIARSYHYELTHKRSNATMNNA